MSNSDIEQTGTVKGHLPNRANLSGRISNVVSLSGHISIGSGAGDFIIRMTIEVNGNNYTVTSCDKTMDQIDAAVASGQNIKAIAFDKYVMPMTQMEYSESYTFGAFIGSFFIAANVYKNPESGTDDWQFYLSPITADIVEYYNAAMPRISTVSEALDELVPNSHTHSNKAVLDKFSETDGKPAYDGDALGRDFIIEMTVERHDDSDYYTVTSCDATIEQIDAAVANEKRVVVIVTDTTTGMFWELPIVQAFQGATYIFIAFTYSGYMMATVYKSGENEIWEFANGGITSEAIHYFNSTQPDVESVHAALNKLFTNSHTHANKAVLDKFAESDGKPTYDGNEIGSDFIIKMTVTSDDNGNYTVTSCDATVEQIDAAVSSEKRVVVIAYYNGVIYELPMLEGVKGSIYYFGMFLQGQVILSFVQKVAENESKWGFGMGQILSEDVGYSNDALPRISTVGDALDELVPKSHTHTNKSVLDKFSETDGKPTYNGEALGSGAGDFIIKMTVTSDDNGKYTVTSCSTTVEQIDAAVAAEKRVVLIATDTDNNLSWDIPIVQGFNGSNYYFATFLLGQAILSFVEKVGENQARWQFMVGQIGADFIGYSNDALPNMSTVGEALDALVTKSHDHVNKSLLDKLSDSNGKLQYNGSDVGLKPVKGTDYWTEVDKQEIVNDTLAALPTWTGGSY